MHIYAYLCIFICNMHEKLTIDRWHFHDELLIFWSRKYIGR